MKKISDPRTNAFIKFFESQGVKFIDVESGEKITAEGDDDENQG